MQLTNWPNKWGNKSSLLFVRLFCRRGEASLAEKDAELARKEAELARAMELLKKYNIAFVS